MDIILKILRDKKKRDKILVVVLSIVLIITVYVNFFRHTHIPEGADRVVICNECGDKTVKLIKDIADDKEAGCKCGKCGGRYGYGFKCEDCSFEWALIPPNNPPAVQKLKTMGKFQYALELQKCPNCSSTRTYPISVKNE